MTLRAAARFAKRVSNALTIRMILVFVTSATICGLLVASSIFNRQRNIRMNMEQLITEKSLHIHDTILHLLQKTQALAALVIQSDGKIENFEKTAVAIVDDPAIINILVAPGGVVAHVYPLENNERVLGYDLLGKGAGNGEAIRSKELGQLVFGGPFELVQGGMALVGRLPVYLDDRTEDGGHTRRFWGLVSVTLRYPEALKDANLESLEREGLAYEVWRINPDDGKRQIIACSGYRYNQETAYVEKPLEILNATWWIRILPVRAWYEYAGNWALIAIALLISGMMTYIFENNHELRLIKMELERMLCTDPLTGVLNRTGLFRAMDKLIADGSPFYLWYLDLNHFKHINDTFGHNTGDSVLIRFSRVMQRHLDDRHVFARISGDEFVLAWKDTIPPITSIDIDNFWKNVDCDYNDSIFTIKDNNIVLSFARGLAYYPEDGGGIDILISCADRRMYMNKNIRYSNENKRRASDYQAAGS